MDLVTHLEIGSPLIWVTTDEPDRVVDVVISRARRQVFRLDALDGLVVWRKNKWLKVLIRMDDGTDKPTYDFGVAMPYVVEQNGLLIIPNAHKSAEELLHVFAGIYTKYRDAYTINDADKLPAQFVLTSCNFDVPPEIARQAAVCSLGLPSGAELADFAIAIDKGSDKPILPEDIDLSTIVRSGIGLTEPEFMQACLMSIRESGSISAEFIGAYKLNKVKQGGVLEIIRPKISLADIGGMDIAKQIIEASVWTWNHPSEAAEYGVKPINRILMIGVPGTGKSAICEATALSLGTELAKFGISKMMSKWVGESESNMRRAFAQVAAMKPIVAWIDELGRDLAGSGQTHDSGTTERTHGEFLQGIQDLPDEVFLMAAANRIDGIPPEMLRADRFDRIMFVGFPTHLERMEIFKIHLGKQAEGHDLDALAASTPFFTGAEIKSLIGDTRFRVSTTDKRHITTQDLVGAAPNLKNRVWMKYRQTVVDMYKRAAVEWDWASSGQQAEAHLILGGGPNQAQTKSTGNTAIMNFG